MTEFETSRVFANVARDLAEQPDLDATIQRLVDMSVQLSGAPTAVLWAPGRDGQARLRAASAGEASQTLHKILRNVAEGPAHTAMTFKRAVLINDLDAEDRWPTYTRAVRAHNLAFRSILVHPLHLGENYLGALGLYSDKPDYFTSDIVEATALLADHATFALQSAEYAHKAGHLDKALESNRRIGMALGILMRDRQMSEDEAFDLVRNVSQAGNRKLRAIADDVIATGVLPDLTGPQADVGQPDR
jgi:GAF domain-containing protein